MSCSICYHRQMCDWERERLMGSHNSCKMDGGRAVGKMTSEFRDGSINVSHSGFISWKTVKTVLGLNLHIIYSCVMFYCQFSVTVQLVFVNINSKPLQVWHHGAIPGAVLDYAMRFFRYS